MKHIIPLVAALLLIGCTGPAPSTPMRPNEITGPSTDDGSDHGTLRVREGSREQLNLPGGTLTFVHKQNESRCPRDVVCVWAGEATILVSFAPPGHAPAFFSLATPGGISDAAAVDTFGYRISLEALSPYPESEHPQPAGLSIATIQIAPIPR